MRAKVSCEPILTLMYLPASSKYLQGEPLNALSRKGLLEPLPSTTRIYAMTPSIKDNPEPQSVVRATSLQRLAKDLDVSAGFLRLEIRRGRLAAIKLGRRVVVSADEARRYLARNQAR